MSTAFFLIGLCAFVVATGTYVSPSRETESQRKLREQVCGTAMLVAGLALVTSGVLIVSTKPLATSARPAYPYQNLDMGEPR